MKFIVLAVVLVLMAGMLHMMFMMYDYAFFDDAEGGLTKLQETLNNSLNSEYRNSTYNTSVMLKNGFGWGRIICIGLVPLCFAIEAFNRSKIEG